MQALVLSPSSLKLFTVNTNSLKQHERTVLCSALAALQVVSASNIVGAGQALEVGKKLELLAVRKAEADAEQARRLHLLQGNRLQPTIVGQMPQAPAALTAKVCSSPMHSSCRSLNSLSALCNVQCKLQQRLGAHRGLQVSWTNSSHSPQKALLRYRDWPLGPWSWSYFAQHAASEGLHSAEAHAAEACSLGQGSRCTHPPASRYMYAGGHGQPLQHPSHGYGRHGDATGCPWSPVADSRVCCLSSAIRVESAGCASGALCMLHTRCMTTA